VSVFGDPANWADFLDPMVPDILRLTVAAWESLPPIAPDEKEDTITNVLCRALRQNRDARELPFQIHTQQVELGSALGTEMGRLDIVFNPPIPREEIYFCLEGKRLNVASNGTTRAYAAEYVSLGMMRFVTGQYSRAVRHGGMIGYVLDRDIRRAIANVEANVRSQHSALCMSPPGNLLDSEHLKPDARARESHHLRAHDKSSFRLHHLFMEPK
jgi:hypothetical protein